MHKISNICNNSAKICNKLIWFVEKHCDDKLNQPISLKQFSFCRSERAWSERARQQTKSLCISIIYMQMKSRSFRRISAYRNALLPYRQASFAYKQAMWSSFIFGFLLWKAIAGVNDQTAFCRYACSGSSVITRCFRYYIRSGSSIIRAAFAIIRGAFAIICSSSSIIRGAFVIIRGVFNIISIFFPCI